MDAAKMSDRKYRQRGYMEDDRRPQKPAQPQSKPRSQEGPRSPRMMAFGEKGKCAGCGATAPATTTADSPGPTCHSALPTCRLCVSFDPGARFECRKPITARIANKNTRNNCELFAARTVVERETSSGAPTDALQAF